MPAATRSSSLPAGEGGVAVGEAASDGRACPAPSKQGASGAKGKPWIADAWSAECVWPSDYERQRGHGARQRATVWNGTQRRSWGMPPRPAIPARLWATSDGLESGRCTTYVKIQHVSILVWSHSYSSVQMHAHFQTSF